MNVFKKLLLVGVLGKTAIMFYCTLDQVYDQGENISSKDLSEILRAAIGIETAHLFR